MSRLTAIDEAAKVPLYKKKTYSADLYDELHRCLNYDPDTGLFFRKITVAGDHHSRRGAPLGFIEKQGYRKIYFKGEEYFSARLVWLYVHRRAPIDVVDHINGIKTDDRLINLREVTNMENAHNVWKARRNSKSGLLGAKRHSDGRWQSSIRAAGKHIYLGLFNAKEDAHAAYMKAKVIHHPTSGIALKLIAEFDEGRMR